MTLKHLLSVSTVAIVSAAFAGDELAITSYTIDGGGGTSTGGDFTLTGTIGQHDAAGAISGSDFTLTGGFWAGGTGGPPPCDGDATGDGMVDVADLLAVLAEWGPCDPVCSADTNGDGTVDVTDLLAVLANWGVCA